MKSVQKLIVASFAFCFLVAVGAGSSYAQVSGNSLLPPTDINTATSRRFIPKIVSADEANQESVQMLQPMASNIEEELPPIVRSASVLTPQIPNELPEVEITEVLPTSANQEFQYRPQSVANPNLIQPPQNQQQIILPPIIQGATAPAGSPVLSNPLGKAMVAEPNYIQSSSPLPMRTMNATYPGFGIQQDEARNPLPMVDATHDLKPMQLSTPNSVGNVLPTESVLMPASRSGMLMPSVGCGGCGSVGCSSCGQNRIGSPRLIGSNYFQRGSASVGCNGCADAGCGSCGGSGANGCTSCGSGGCFDVNEVDKRFAACGFISRARRYFILDALYLTRSNGEVRGINLSPINDFDYGFGARITSGRRTDAANGREFSYFGSFDIEEGGVVTDALGRINRTFIPDGTFLSAASVSPFSNVNVASEQLETSVHSFELNRVRWGWDVVKVLFGARYVYLEDDYDLRTANIFAETGTLSVDAKNHMIGPQVGLEMFYDVGFRWSLSGFGKFGLMLNAYDADVNATANGFGLTSSGTNEADLSYLVDLGITAHYQLTTQSRFRIGFNALYLGDVTTANEAFPFVLSPFSASSLDADDDALFTGLSFGFEFYR